MTDESMPFQGSLFGETKQTSNELESLQKSHLPEKDELSDDQLKKNAKQKPRTKKKSALDKQWNKSFSELQKQSSSLEDIPQWSHHSQVEIEELTPVLRHYVELKKDNPERVLLYRLGDFFECFFEDAINLSQLLELTLTGKEGGKNIGRVPMAGIPHHASERYCSTLIQKGLSVAICDQLESVQNKEGRLIKRGITRILTPGTVIEEGLLHARRNNWLAAVLIEHNQEQNFLEWGLASADISTGEFFVKEGIGLSSLEQELMKIEASEVICEQLEEKIIKDWDPKRIHLKQVPKTPFSLPEAQSTLKRHYKIKTVDGLGLKESDLAIRASGGLVNYLHETNPSNELNDDVNVSDITLEFPQISFSKEALIIDAQTRRNLEITTTQRDGQFQGSFLWAIDRTLTAMGGRCLRRWLEAPLTNPKDLLKRQAIVSLLVNKKELRKGLRGLLRAMGDLERLAGRANAGHAGARDLIAIADGIERMPRLAANLRNLTETKPEWFIDIEKIDPKLINLAKKIRHYLISNPPLSLSDGGLINDCVDPVLDGLRNKLDEQNKWLDSQELLERKLSKNNNLRLQYHRTFGYFLAVSKSKSNNVPSHWIRRQTLANEERFITPDLKSREGKIFQIKSRATDREYELFCELRKNVGDYAHSIRKAAKAIAGLDALAGLAELAASQNYCAPEIIEEEAKNRSRRIFIKGCRHAVVEQILVEEKFQPNDIDLGINSDLIILTGPNASGKSCYLRQIGLIQLLAQIGSWVPAEKATLSIADQIFTRVGAVDDLAAGQSTFMVEMAETAYILNRATSSSLVLLDEIGRGTSTYDGLSIAWSVSEFLAKEIRSRTIFATHYHELNSLSEILDNVINFQVLVKETGESIEFLHKVVPGGADKSYGIAAARLAGIPTSVIEKAKEILQVMEKNDK